MTAPSWIREGVSDLNDLKRRYQWLLTLDPEILRLVSNWFSEGEANLSLTDNSRSLLKYLEKSDLEGSNVSTSRCSVLLESLMLLGSTNRAVNWTPDSLLEFLQEAEPETPESTDSPQRSLQIHAEAKEAILSFLEQKERFEILFKAQRVYGGLRPSFSSCSSLVEFRPVFDEKRAAYKDGVLSSTLEIEIRRTYDAEPESFQFELDLQDMDDLESEIKHLKKKLTAVRDKIIPETKLLNPLDSINPTGESI